MNKLDNYTLQFRHQIYQSVMKALDEELHKREEYFRKYGRRVEDITKDTATNTPSEDDKLIGYINTLVMVIEDTLGKTLNWDQTAATLSTARKNSYNTTASEVTANIND